MIFIMNILIKNEPWREILHKTYKKRKKFILCGFFSRFPTTQTNTIIIKLIKKNVFLVKKTSNTKELRIFADKIRYNFF